MSNPFSSTQHENPYASPLADEGPIRPDFSSGDEEVIRRRYLSHEASVRAIGLLYYIACAFFLVATAGMVLAIAQGETINATGAATLFTILSVLAVVTGTLGWGLRRLKAWSRLGTILFASLNLLLAVTLYRFNPVGMLINIYILWLLGSAKGKFVFSEEYQHARSATPHIKYKTSKIIWALLAILLSLVLVGVAVAIGSAFSG
ncbi:hypothetical protein Pla175_39850 [Pirellulimonas nuda]|uniref:Uncharacterized protein n=1 Tax=Pirellulimonas nuda TaxID=2528009 RepID=A0A518DGH9_9BACT|nr:hypothetical protein [Pirellulimonas nuda]QDU90578.1 hypothetical protein Pla175_39850 [Pirellulimonas nuda]